MQGKQTLLIWQHIILSLMHINVLYTHAKSTFKHDTVIQDHLLRDRPHQGIGINGKMFYLCRYGQAGVNRRAAGILN